MGKSKSRQRRRTEKQAIDALDGAGLSPARKRAAAERIRAARQPVAEARRIVEQTRRDELRGVIDIGGEIDLSDVQELRVTLHRRDGGVWSPQSDMLARMERLAAVGEMDPDSFRRMAGVLMAMEQAIPASQRRPVA